MVLLWKIHGSVVIYISMIAIRMRGDYRKGASGEGMAGTSRHLDFFRFLSSGCDILFGPL